MAARIISQALLKELLHYDPITGFFTWLPRPLSAFPSAKSWKWWHTRFCGKRAGSLQDGKYRLIPINGRYLKAHRLAWLYVYGVMPSQDVDHENQQYDDNWIANLRDISNTENHRNKPRYKNNKSGRMGVYQRPENSKWRAYIYTGGRLKHLGTFEDFEDAVAAREAAERKHGFHENHGRSIAI